MMPYFLCRLAAENGRVFSQSFFAPSLKECRKHFETEGYCVLSVKREWKKIQISLRPFEKKIKDKDLIMFNQEFMALTKAGYPILKSLGIITGRAKNIHLKELLMQIENEIRGGKSLSEAFAPYEKNFSTVYTASLMAGESSGNLASSLGRFIIYSKVISQTKAKIRTAMAYPSLLLVFSFILFGILINFILPRFSAFYTDFEAQLPAITRALMTFAVAVRNHLLHLAVFALLLFVIFIQMKKREKTLIFLDRLKLKIPYARSIWLESATSLFCRTLGLLLEGGISLLSSIGVACQAVPNKYLVQKMKDLPENIKNGMSLTESLMNAGCFPLLAQDMIKVGETSANLEGMLIEVADVYDERIQEKIDTFVSLIEPVVIIFMGLVVAAMLLAVYLPIFNIIRVAG